MDKLTMAHEYFLRIVSNPSVTLRAEDLQNIQNNAWSYADAMQAEADKRESNNIELKLNNDAKILYGDGLEIDWSQAPDWANWWVIGPLTKQGIWSETQPVCVKFNGVNYWEVTSPLGGEHLSVAPSFSYQGNWKDSLRKRP